MKKFLKMAALMLLAGALVVGFASCSNGSDDSSSSSSKTTAANGVVLGNVLATYYKVSDSGETVTLYDNGVAAKAHTAAASKIAGGIYSTGKFTASASSYKDVTISITWTSSIKQENSTTFETDNTSKSKTFVNGTSTDNKWKLKE